jgi:hypothetical protein
LLPFFSVRWLAAFILLLAVLLTLPVVLALVGASPRAEVYRGMNRQWGNYPYFGRIAFEDTSDIDILFIGPSLTGWAFDGPIITKALKEQLGRSPKIVVGSVNFFGPDLDYYLLRDLMARRHVGTVVLSFGFADARLPMLHPFLYRFLRWGDYPDIFTGLTLPQRGAVYGSMVLGAPREVLNLVRPNRNTDTADWNDPGAVNEQGYQKTRFVPDRRRPPLLAAAAMIYSPATAAHFRFGGGWLSDYHVHYLRRMGELLREHHTKVVVLNIPADVDYGSPVVREQMYWPDYLGQGTIVAGIPPATLFPGLSQREYLNFFLNIHMNRNGRDYFSAAIVPLLRDLN